MTQRRVGGTNNTKRSNLKNVIAVVAAVLAVLFAFVGANKTARVANTVTSIVFRVLGDGKELWSSGEIGAYSDEVAADVDVSGVNRLALVADSHGGNVLGEE